MGENNISSVVAENIETAELLKNEIKDEEAEKLEKELDEEDNKKNEQPGEDELFEYLTPEDIKFYNLHEDFIGAQVKGVNYDRISIVRALPYSSPDEYLCVKDSDLKEIGMIKALSEFSIPQRAIVNKHLKMRYFCPIVKSVISVKQKYGLQYVTINTDSGKKIFVSTDLTKSIIRIHDDKFIIVDIDGNRFLIEDLFKIGGYKKLLPHII